MEKLQSSRPEEQAAIEQAGLLLQRAKTQSTMLRRAFHLFAARRSDSSKWFSMENDAASLLEQHLDGPLDGKQYRFLIADRRLEEQVAALLTAALPHGGRCGQYRRAPPSSGLRTASQPTCVAFEGPESRPLSVAACR